MIRASTQSTIDITPRALVTPSGESRLKVLVENLSGLPVYLGTELMQKPLSALPPPDGFAVLPYDSITLALHPGQNLYAVRPDDVDTEAFPGHLCEVAWMIIDELPALAR